jgi:hypothetical protein
MDAIDLGLGDWRLIFDRLLIASRDAEPAELVEEARRGLARREGQARVG